MMLTMNYDEPHRTPCGKAPVRKNILLVDSEEPYREILGALLEEEGHRVTSSGELLEAIQLLRKERFDLVITDYSPSGVNGLRLLEFIKQSDDNNKLPVLVVSFHYECEPYLAAMNMGALDYLGKPLDYVELQRLITSPQKACEP